MTEPHDRGATEVGRVSDEELDALSETVEASKAQGAEWIRCSLPALAVLLEEIRERREAESKGVDMARKAISSAETKSAGADVIVADAEARRVAAEQRAIAAEARAARLERESDAVRGQLAALREAASLVDDCAEKVVGWRDPSGLADEALSVMRSALANTAPAAEAYTQALSGANATGIRREVLAFARLMEMRLRAHDDRGARGWAECRPEWLMKRLREETKELREALNHKSCGCRSAGECMHGLCAPSEEPHEEAADVANFAMMIADVCGYLGEDADSSRAAELRGGR